MKKKIYSILIIFLTGFILFLAHETMAQGGDLITINSSLTDEQGQPVINAEVYTEGASTRTNVAGEFNMKIKSGSKIVIEAEGYQKTMLSFDEIKSIIQLQKVSLLAENSAPVNLAFRTTSKGNVIGAASGYQISKISQYDNTIWAGGILTGRALGMLGSNNIRGLGISFDVGAITGTNTGTAMAVVDGLPRDLNSIRLADIESISVLRDVNSAVLYGSAAMNGVVLITTKRGEQFKKRSAFTANYGISVPKILPKYLNSADYMVYFNKAREGDGFAEPQYSDEMIENYRSGNKYRYPDVDYYSDEYLRPFKTFFDLDAEFSDGNENARYYTNVGWYSAGSLLNFGEGENARANAFSVRGNVDLKINNWINTAVDGTALFSSSIGPRASFWNAVATVRPFEFTPLLPFDLIDPENSLLKSRKNDVDGQYLIGGNSKFVTHAIGHIYAAGTSQVIWRNFSFNNRINFDLGKITQGLSFHTNISFDYYLAYNQVVSNQYSVYEPTWADDQDLIIKLKQHGKDARPGTQNVEGRYFRRRFGFYGLLSYDRTFNNRHHLTGSLFGYGNTFKDNDGAYTDFQGIKQAHVGFQLSYILDKKYMADFSSAYVNSVRLPAGNKGALSPTIALAWAISEEDVLSSAKGIDYLKLKVSAGILNSDIPIGGFFYYDNPYTTSGSYSWYEGGKSRSAVVSSWSSNRNLDFAKRKEISAGFEGLFLNKLLNVEANYFYDIYDGLVVRPTSAYPGFFSDFVPYENFEADQYQGVELGLSLNKTWGDWNFYTGANVLYSTSKRTKVNEFYKNDYQYRKGHPKDATFGLESLGFFQNQEEIEQSPRQLFGTVRPGDLKYKDQNGDNIVDANDEVFLRRWQDPWSGGLEIRVSWKNLTLFLLGEGRLGSKNFRESTYYWMDGTAKYSEIIRQSWTEETKNVAKYPRVSSQSNSNNLRRSSFWLYKNDYFNLERVQLNYAMPHAVSKALSMNDLIISLNATQLFQFAKNRKFRELRVGSEPYYTTYAITLKANF
jgi:TonB-linked SusC/RagA family outer membrane protein